MPIKKENRARYPKNWKSEIVPRIRARSGNRCECTGQCGIGHTIQPLEATTLRCWAINGEKHPMWAWDLNMKGLLNVLELARTHKLDKVFWPSSIAAFGPTTPRDGTPQKTVMEPTTVYGISKQAGERELHQVTHRATDGRGRQPE